MVLDGEPGWICLMCCNIDVLFSVLVLQWVTSKDNASTLSFSQSASHTHTHSNAAGPKSGQPDSSVAGNELGLRSDTKRPRIITSVTAAKLDDEEVGDIGLGNGLGKNVITVKGNHIQEIEVNIEGERRSQAITSVSDGLRRGNMGGTSTDDLFRKD